MQKNLFFSGKVGKLNKHNRLKTSVAAVFVGLFTFLPFISSAQNQTTPQQLSGLVVDESNVPISDVNILNIKTKQIITTNAKGEFFIKESNFPITLSFSLTGYTKKEVQFTKAVTGISVMLHSDNKLNEVVVVGYGTTTKLKNTGSVGKINGSTLTQQPISDPILAMQGRIPGVFVTTSSGNLGSSPTLKIRGTNSLASSTNPLYIVDGVSYPSQSINDNTYGGPTGYTSPFVNINSADIESIEILKDADATAIYGARGANGVILITTKKGKEGATQVSVDLYRGIQDAPKRIDFLNTKDYIQMRKDAFKADGTALLNTNAYDVLVWGDQRYTNFQDLLYGKTAQLTNAQFSVQGGNQNTQYILGIGYRDENGVVFGKNNQRKGTARLNVNHVSDNNKFTINSTFTYNSTKTATIGTDGVDAIMSSPNMPLTDEATGYPYFYGNSVSSPLTSLYTSTNLSSYNFIGATTVGYKLLKNLEAKVDASFTRLDYNSLSKYKTGYINPANKNSSIQNFATFGSDYQYSYSVEPQINYNETIGKGKLTALLGTSFQETINGGQSVNGSNFSSEALMGALSAAASVSDYKTEYTQYKFNSIFGRLTYDFDNKYILNTTFRRDGSSRFGPDKKFGNFWAVGAAWIASNESFIKDNFKFVSLAKLRGSYGLTGNDGIGNYLYLSTFSATYSPYNNNAGLFANNFGNPDLSWETNRKFEVAAELNFFNNRITTVTSFFNNISGNQLAVYPLSGVTGFSGYVKNIDAKIRNRGLEFDLTTLNVNGKDFKWRTNFNITANKNTLLAFPNLSTSAYNYTYEIGKSLNLYHKYEFLGIDQATGTPLIKDQDNDGSITSRNDRITVGTSDPKFYGGFGNTFSYKGIELDVFFQFTKQPYQNSYFEYFNSYQPGSRSNQPSFMLDGVWREPGQNATRPRLSAAESGEFIDAYELYQFSNVTLEDASYIRLKNASLSYTLPTSVVQKLKLSNVRFYALGQNLWTLTKYKGFDPETASSETPPIRTFTFGINVSL